MHISHVLNGKLETESQNTIHLLLISYEQHPHIDHFNFLNEGSFKQILLPVLNPYIKDL